MNAALPWECGVFTPVLLGIFDGGAWAPFLRDADWIGLISPQIFKTYRNIPGPARFSSLLREKMRFTGLGPGAIIGSNQTKDRRPSSW